MSDRRPDGAGNERDPLAPGDKDPVDRVDARTDDPYVLAEDRSDSRGPQQDAERWHGAVRNPDHPEFHDRDDRVAPPEEPLIEATRSLVVDDVAERHALAAADPADPTTVMPDRALDPASGIGGAPGIRADDPADARRRLRDAEPGV